MPNGQIKNKDFTCSTVGLVRQGAAPATLCMVTMHPDSRIFLLKDQVMTQLAPAACNDSLFRRLLHKVPHACHFQASLPIMLRLKSRKLVKTRASHAQLLSRATCRHILKTLGTDSTTLDSLDALIPALPGSSPTLAPPCPQQHPAVLRSSSAHDNQPSLNLPATLPKAKYNAQELSQRYGLKANSWTAELLEHEPLRSQLDALHEWLTEPINLLRGKKKSVSELTWDKGYQSVICTYLGFCHNFKAVAFPSLEHFLDADCFSSYMDFLIQRVSAAFLHGTSYCGL